MNLLIVLAALLTPEAPYLPAYLEKNESTSARYADCVRTITDDVDAGRRAAEAWASEGGGAPALHCLAVSDLASGLPKLAAVRLTEISERRDAGDRDARARLLAEAALAWIDARDLVQAEASVDAAKRMSPSLAELDFVAAKVFAAGGKWQAAFDAVTAAEQAGLKAPETYVIRARANRALGKDMDAANDVVAALTLDPYYIDALTLRGELQQAGIEIEAYYGDGQEGDKK
jgi:tetratricopeptide (TPR) repeat protein